MQLTIRKVIEYRGEKGDSLATRTDQYMSKAMQSNEDHNVQPNQLPSTTPEKTPKTSDQEC